MRKVTGTAICVAAMIGLAGCNNAPAPPADPVTEELPVEEMAPSPDAADAMAAPDDAAAAPAADATGPDGAGPSSSTGGRVTPPGQE